MIQVYSNSLGEEELAAIREVFKSKWLGMGRECQALEQELAEYWNTGHVLLLNNCTAGLYIALKALGVQPGDEVIVSTFNFLGCVNAILELGATPVFADVDPLYFNILPEEIERLRSPKTRAVYILHYGGHPCDFEKLEAACGDDIHIIEDSANSVSSTYRGRSCGTLGSAGAFSFDAMKILVMGDGGALILKDNEIYTRAKSLRYLGFQDKTTSGADARKQGNDRWWEFDLECASGRMISNDVLAAAGRIQLRKLPGFIDRRRQVWDIYQKELAKFAGLQIPPEPLPDTSSSYYMYWIKTEKRDELAHYLADKGIYSTFRYFPLHLVPYYNSGVQLKNAEAANETALNLPLHQNLSDDDAGTVVDMVKQFFS